MNESTDPVTAALQRAQWAAEEAANLTAQKLGEARRTVAGLEVRHERETAERVALAEAIHERGAATLREGQRAEQAVADAARIGQLVRESREPAAPASGGLLAVPAVDPATGSPFDPRPLAGAVAPRHAPLDLDRPRIDADDRRGRR